MGTPMQTSYRTLTCADARLEHAGDEATLAGWVNRRRDLGHLIFLDLRDRYGVTQVVVDATEAPAAHEVASGVRSEYVLRVGGTIARARQVGEPALATGAGGAAREHDPRALGGAHAALRHQRPDADIDEALRLKYRYLDLRREPLQQRILARGRLVQAIRETCTTPPASWRSRRRCSSSPRRRARATSSCPRGCSPATSTRCPRARSSSSSCSWSPASTATSRSPAACATRTCAATASRSSRSSTWR